jgi:hypothetical protein
VTDIRSDMSSVDDAIALLKLTQQLTLDMDRAVTQANGVIADDLITRLLLDRRRLARAADAIERHAPAGARVMWCCARVHLTVAQLVVAMRCDDTTQLRMWLLRMRACRVPSSAKECHPMDVTCSCHELRDINCIELHPRACQFGVTPVADYVEDEEDDDEDEEEEARIATSIFDEFRSYGIVA